MTIFGPDISSYEAGVNVRALTDPFILLKVTEGTYYVDADYEAFLAQAQATGKLAIPYHFVTTQDPDAQALFIAAHIGDKALPLMLDFEPQTQTGSRPTVDQLAALIDRCVAHGLRPRLAYFPHWYWQELGSPSLAPLVSRGQGLISSAYPGGTGYPGDAAAGWNAYGGMTPLLYQYTDAAYEGGQKLGDMNAFRGTIAQLAAFLGAAAPTTTGGADMATIPDSIAHHFPGMDLSGDFPAGVDYTVEGAAIWSDARAEAAYRQSATNTGLLNQVLAVLKQQAIDPATLAAAVAAKLPVAGAPDPALIAAAVEAALEQHGIGGVDPIALASALAAHFKVV